MAGELDELGETLFAIQQALKKRGIPDMPDDTIRELSRLIPQHNLVGQVDPEQIADQVLEAMRGRAGGAQAQPQSMPLMPQTSPDQAIPRLPVGQTRQPGQLRRTPRGFPQPLPEVL